MDKIALMLDWPNNLVPWPCWASIWNGELRMDPEVTIYRATAADANLTANSAVMEALERGAEEFIFLAADQELPRKALSRFRETGKAVVGALTTSRQPGLPFLAGKFRGENRVTWVVPSAPLDPMDVVGVGCMYVKAEVFRTIPAPWFKTVVSDDCLSLIMTNDMWFFKKCKEHGIEPHIDATMESPHHHETILTARSLHRNAPYLVEVH